MTWARIDDSFPDHPKVVRLSDRAFRLHVTGICYCAQHLTDGRIGKTAARSMGASPKLLRELLGSGVWREEGDEWVIHDYLVYNPSREKVLAERRATAERKDRMVARRNGVPNTVENAVPDGVRNNAPYPSRPTDVVTSSGEPTLVVPEQPPGRLTRPASFVEIVEPNGPVARRREVTAVLEVATAQGARLLDSERSSVHEECWS